MRKLIAYLSLFTYLFFSQFAIKAVATTNPDVANSGDVTCMTKKLDTFEWKYSCREKNNAAVFSMHFDPSTFLDNDNYCVQINDVIEYRYAPNAIDEPYILSQGPPWESDTISTLLFLESYVGVSLLLF